jgi:hypothetical protein
MAQTQKIKPQPRKNMAYHTGWINRQGYLYGCSDWEHSDLAYDLGYSYSQLDDEGWIHVGVVDGVFIYRGEPTQAQLNTLWNIFEDTDSEELRNYIQEFFRLHQES